MHLVIEFNITRVKSVVHVSEDYREVCKNITIEMFLMSFSTLTFFDQISHHLIPCNNCILTMSEVTGNEVKVVVAQVKVKLDSTFVTYHSE